MGNTIKNHRPAETPTYQSRKTDGKVSPKAQPMETSPHESSTGYSIGVAVKQYPIDLQEEPQDIRILQNNESKQKKAPDAMMVMLGPSGVGKSTFVKSIKASFSYDLNKIASHKWGLSEQDRKAPIWTLIKSLVTMTLDLCQLACAFEEEGAEIGDRTAAALLCSGIDVTEGVFSEQTFDLMDDIESIMARGHNSGEHGALSEKLKLIWKDETVIAFSDAALDSAHASVVEKEWVYANARMCIGYLDRIFNDGFEMSHEEILRIREPTLDMTRTLLRHKNRNIEMVDIGGQLHLRQEWSSVIRTMPQDMPNVILFVVSLPDYK